MKAEHRKTLKRIHKELTEIEAQLKKDLWSLPKERKHDEKRYQLTDLVHYISCARIDVDYLL